jgi:hypothetical protein
MDAAEFTASMSEVVLFQQGREAAQARLVAARTMCDAVAGQDYVVQAEATRDLTNAIAVASEWGLCRQSRWI